MGGLGAGGVSTGGGGEGCGGGEGWVKKSEAFWRRLLGQASSLRTKPENRGGRFRFREEKRVEVGVLTMEMEEVLGLGEGGVARAEAFLVGGEALARPRPRPPITQRGTSQSSLGSLLFGHSANLLRSVFKLFKLGRSLRAPACVQE